MDAAQVIQTFERYKTVTESLCRRAAALGDEATLRLLGRIWHRLEQGPIRLLVLGVSSAGKSTLLNALAGDVVVPEGSTATSPLPVWLKRGDVNLDLFDRSSPDFPRREPMGLFTFITQFCYSALDYEPARYARYSAAECCRDTIHPALEGVTVIDTPGLRASSSDDERAHECAELGCEMVVLVCSAENGTGALSQADGQYFCKLFEEIKLPMPQSLFVVGNVRDVAYGGMGAEAGFERVAKLHFGKYTRLFRFDVRAARVLRAGAYRYADLLPEKVKNDEERDNAGKRQRAELAFAREARGESEGFWVTDYAEAGAQLDELCAAVRERACELLQAPEELIAPVKEQLRQAAVRLMQQDADDPACTCEHEAIRQLGLLEARLNKDIAGFERTLAELCQEAQQGKGTGAEDLVKLLHRKIDFHQVFCDEALKADDEITAAVMGETWENLHAKITERYAAYVQGKQRLLTLPQGVAALLHKKMKAFLADMDAQLRQYDQAYRALHLPDADAAGFTALIGRVVYEADHLISLADFALQDAARDVQAAFDVQAFDRIMTAEISTRREALVQRKWGSKFFLYANMDTAAHTCYRQQAAEAVRRLSSQYYAPMSALTEARALRRALLQLREHVEALRIRTHRRLVEEHYAELLGESLQLPEK